MENTKEELKEQEEIPDVEVDLEDDKEEETEVEEVKKPKKVNLPDKLDKITDEKIRGRIIVFNPEESEFAKNLELKKAGDYVEKK